MLLTKLRLLTHPDWRLYGNWNWSPKYFFASSSQESNTTTTAGVPVFKMVTIFCRKRSSLSFSPCWKRIRQFCIARESENQRSTDGRFSLWLLLLGEHLFAESVPRNVMLLEQWAFECCFKLCMQISKDLFSLLSLLVRALPGWWALFVKNVLKVGLL